MIRSIDSLSFNSKGEASALDFLHYILLEYQRLQLKAYHDEEIMHRQRKRKLAEITVPPVDELFYKEPAIIIKNFDYENAVYVQPTQYITQHTDGSLIAEIDEALLRIAAPASRAQNNPPKTREEQRKERIKEKNQENEDHALKGLSTAPKVIKTFREPTKNEEERSKEREEHARPPHKKVLKSKNKDLHQNIFSQEDFISGPHHPTTKSKTVSKKVKIPVQAHETLSPSKSSKGHLQVSPSIPAVFSNGSERGHTSSYRSLYNYGSRGQDIISRQVDTKTPADDDSEEERPKADFSNFLSSAAQKPSFLTRSNKKRKNTSNYHANHNVNRSPPELPPRDFSPSNEFKLRQSMDMDQSEDTR